MKDNNVLQFHRRWKRVTSTVAIAFFLFQNSVAVFANVLSNADIELDLGLEPGVYQQENGQYQAKDYLADTEISSIRKIEEFYKKLSDNRKESLGIPTYTPIAIDDLFIVIPVYANPEPVGDVYVQNRYVRAQIYELLGRHLINADNYLYSDEITQLNTLYQAGYNYAVAAPFYTYGTNLAEKNISRIAAPVDMVWPEKRIINGKEVVVPVVYLTAQTVKSREVTTHQTYLGNVTTFSSLTLNDVELKTSRNAVLNALNDISCNGCAITSSGALTLLAGGSINSISGLISAQDDLILGARNVSLITDVHRYDLGSEQGTRLGAISSVESVNGDIQITAIDNIIMAGATITATNGGISLQAGNSIYISTAETTTYENGIDQDGWTYERSSVDYLSSKLSARDTIELIAGSEIIIDAAEIVSSEGHIRMLAELGITIDSQESTYQNYQKGKFGRQTKEISEYQTIAIRTLLDAGKKVVLNTELGDITLNAADITSNEGTELIANNGGVNFLITTETDHYSYNSTKNNLFTTSTRSMGHNIETGVANTIVGGLKVEALKRVNVQYKGNPELSLDSQIAEMSKLEGMAWMAQVRSETPDADWEAIELQYNTWRESNTSLSPAFAAVVAIAVAMAAGPMGGQFATSILTASGAAVTTTGTLYVGISAATTALITQSSMALANGIVNDDIAGAMKDIASEETFKSLATAAITAGAMHYINAEVFVGDNSSMAAATESESVAKHIASTQSPMAQVGIVLRDNTIRSGIQVALEGGDLGDFKYALKQSLADSAIAYLGKEAANAIGERFNAMGTDPTAGDTAIKYISHAAAGCVQGVLIAASAGGAEIQDCNYGAGGALAGEFIGDITQAVYEQRDKELTEWLYSRLGAVANGEISMSDYLDHGYQMTEDLMALKQKGIDLARLGAALSAFVAGATADQINIAADTGQNAAENNAVHLLIPAALFIVKMIDTALTINDINDIIQAYQSTPNDPTAGDALLEAFLIDGAFGIAIGAIIPGGKTFEALLKKMQDAGFGEYAASLYDLARAKAGLEIEPKDLRFNQYLSGGYVDMLGLTDQQAHDLYKHYAPNGKKTVEDIALEIKAGRVFNPDTGRWLTPSRRTDIGHSANKLAPEKIPFGELNYDDIRVNVDGQSLSFNELKVKREDAKNLYDSISDKTSDVAKSALTAQRKYSTALGNATTEAMVRYKHPNSTRMVSSLQNGLGTGEFDYIYGGTFGPDGKEIIRIYESKGGSATLGTRKASDGLLAEQGSFEYAKSIVASMRKKYDNALKSPRYLDDMGYRAKVDAYEATLDKLESPDVTFDYVMVKQPVDLQTGITKSYAEFTQFIVK